MNRRYYLPISLSSNFFKFYDNIAKKYPKELFEVQRIGEKHLDILDVVNDYRNSNENNVVNAVIDDNANVTNGKNAITLEIEKNKGIDRLIALDIFHKGLVENYNIEIADKIIEKVINGEIAINDLHKFLFPYCYGFSLYSLVADGMHFYKPLKINKPKHPQSFINLVIQSIMIFSRQLSGAVSLPDFFIFLDYMFRKYDDNKQMYYNILDKILQKYKTNNIELTEEEKTYIKYVENMFQNFIYSVNFPFRSDQSPFVNVSIFSKDFLEALFNDLTIPDFSKPNLETTYKLQKWFAYYFNKIQLKENIFTFPVTTLAIGLNDNNEIVDKDFLDFVAEINSTKAIFNIYVGETNTFSSCCRLKNEIKEYHNSFGVGGVSIGSLKVISVNLPRLAYISNNMEELKEKLQNTLEDIIKLHIVWRKHIDKLIDEGLLPLYKYGLINKKNQYSTIGYVGFFEAIKEMAIKIYGFNRNDKIPLDIIEKLGKEIFNVFTNIRDKYNKEYADQFMFNIEQIPAESMAVRLAKIDKILGYNNYYELYSNQYIPLIEKDYSIMERIKAQGFFDKSSDGGSILHLNIVDDTVLSKEQMKKLIEYAIKNECVYFAINYPYSKCENGHIVIGDKNECSICGNKNIIKYTRVVGFITPINSWNKIRKDYEYKNRKFYEKI